MLLPFPGEAPMRYLAFLGAMLSWSVTRGAVFSARQSGHTYEVGANGRLVFAYHAPPQGPKPFLHPVHTPGGHSVTTDRSVHPHHHGLWFTWGQLRLFESGESVDFWRDAEGVVVPVWGPRVTVCGRNAQLISENEWRKIADGLVLLRERRTVILHDAGTPRAHLLSIVSDQVSLRPLVLSHESNEKVAYYGLAVQMPRDMNNGQVVNRRGGRGRSGVEGIPAAWCAYATNVVPPRGVALFDHPANPRHPNSWFTLDSGFLSTSLVAHQDYFLPAGATLRLRYGVLVFDGDFNERFVSRMYKRWLECLDLD